MGEGGWGQSAFLAKVGAEAMAPLPWYKCLDFPAGCDSSQKLYRVLTMEWLRNCLIEKKQFS